jgi:hypothetical protein
LRFHFLWVDEGLGQTFFREDLVDAARVQGPFHLGDEDRLVCSVPNLVPIYIGEEGMRTDVHSVVILPRRLEPTDALLGVLRKQGLQDGTGVGAQVRLPDDVLVYYVSDHLLLIF